MLFICYGKCLVLGYVEAAHMSDFTFENQRRTFTSYGEYPNITVKPVLYNGPLFATTVQPTYNYLLFVSFHAT